MEVGNVTESVAVTAQTPLVNAVSSEQLETVSELRVSELPLSRRNFTGLLQLNTGVTQADGAMPTERHRQVWNPIYGGWNASDGYPKVAPRLCGAIGTTLTFLVSMQFKKFKL